MNMIKRHKGLAIVLGLTLILVIIIFAIFARMLLSTGKSEYGDRLNELTELRKSVLDDVKSTLESNEEVTSASLRIQGRIVYTTINVTKETAKDKAKELAAKTLEKYSEEVIADYDFEFLIKQEEVLDDEGNNKSYTIAGTKHPEKDKISWTRN